MNYNNDNPISQVCEVFEQTYPSDPIPDPQTYADIERILIPGHPRLTARLRQFATRYVRRQRTCWNGYDDVSVPGDLGRTGTLRVHLRDIEYLLKDVPEDRRQDALAHTATVLVRLWHRADPRMVDHARLMEASKMFFINRTNKSYLTGSVVTDGEDELEARRRAA